MYQFFRSLIDPLTIPFLLFALALAYTWYKHADVRKVLRWVLLAFVLAWMGTCQATAYLACGVLEWR